MLNIDEIIVVEGLNDLKAVKKALNAEVIVVSGFGINKKIIDVIRTAQARRGVILFFDPDFAGNKIRSIVSKRVKEMEETEHYQMKDTEYKSQKNIGKALEEVAKGLIHLN